MTEEIKKYDSMSTFLNDCKSMLMQKECENNVILGICSQFLDKSIDSDKFILIAAIEENGVIVSCAVTTPNKTFLATCIKQFNTAVRSLANYFNRHQINLRGLSGEIAVVNSFMEVYQKPVSKSTTLLLNILNTLQNIKLVSNSELLVATMQDQPVLTKWLKNFHLDAGLLPLRPDEEIEGVTKDKIERKACYKLVINGTEQPVSMVAVARETENFAIISWVYTPLELRGRGYATTAVYKLTKVLLDTQKKYCALFTDKSNPVSNKIYQHIGYQPAAEYLDIAFQTL